MKFRMVYDFGVHKGGGDYVMLNIVEALSNAGYDVSLLTSNPQGLYESAEFFNKNTPNVDIHYINVPRFLRHPYTIAYMAWKVVQVKRDGYDIYVVSDDIPSCISSEKSICYMHYPHTARFKFKEYVAGKYKATLRGRLVWQAHKILFPKFYLTNNPPENWLLIANSIVTRKHAAEVFHVNSESIILLNPPVDSYRINKYWKNSGTKKEDLIVCIGRFEHEKRFADVLHAVARLKNRAKIKLSLIGFTCDENELAKTIRELGLEGNAELLVNASRRTVIDRLLRAKAIVHPTPHEPFGIAVVEGMATGCIPIVRRGFNCPWLEITREGRYGLGFSSVEELANTLKKISDYYESFDVKAIALRALEFDEADFRCNFIRIFERSVAKASS